MHPDSEVPYDMSDERVPREDAGANGGQGGNSTDFWASIRADYGVIHSYELGMDCCMEYAFLG